MRSPPEGRRAWPAGRRAAGRPWRPGLLIAVLLFLPGVVLAQNAAELRAFDAAARAFQDAIYDRAEKEFGQFVGSFPESPRVPEAILFQAQSALKQQSLKGTVDLLTAHLAKAGTLTDQYHYWLAEAHLKSNNYQAAADSFARLIKDFPSSARLLEASYGEALARFKMRDWRRVADLLRPTNGTFRQSAQVRGNDELVARGQLLLGEALLEQRDYGSAETAVSLLPEKDLIPEFKWRRQYLLCRIQVAGQRLPEALANTTNLLVLASATGQPLFQAETTELQGRILEQLNQLEAAAQAYERNLAEGTPAERRRHAFLKIIELTLAQKKFGAASELLQAFFTRYPEEVTSDLALLTLGELHLKQHFAGWETNAAGAVTNPPAATNHLQLALAHFEKLLKTFTNSALSGKALLNKGWCLWTDGKIPESQVAFRAAAEQLPFSEEQAVARFKLADAQFQQGSLTNARRNFRLVINDYSDLPRVKDTLFDQALYKILLASSDLGDLAGASDAMGKILAGYPNSFFSDRSMLLVGQNMTLAGKPGEARAVFAKFAAQFSASPLLPEVELALVRTYVQERDWPSAIKNYEVWIGRFGTNRLRPLAEYNQAWVNYRAGHESNAFRLFTNFVARFATNDLAPSAQYWTGDYYFRQGDFVNAEINYQRVFQDWPTNALSYPARMRAGLAATARRSYKDASDYFAALLNNNHCPPALAAEALFALGDTITARDADAAKPLQKFSDAVVPFSKIPQQYPASPLVPRAWGAIGNCYLQLGTQDLKNYDYALDAYQKALASATDVSTRSQAEVGLGLVLERQSSSPETPALLKAAFDHYYNVVIGKNLLPGETPDPFWTREAGLAAARLAEDQRRWEVVVNIYNRLLSVLPPMRPALEKRIEKAREQLR